MHRPQRYRRKAWRRKKPAAPVVLSRRETINLLAFAVVGCIVMVLAIHSVSGWKIRRDREHSLATMQTEYSLTDAQLAAIREIETFYHGSGSVLTRPSHTFEEEAAHSLALSKHMSPEAASRFLDTRKKNAGFISHKH